LLRDFLKDEKKCGSLEQKEVRKTLKSSQTQTISKERIQQWNRHGRWL
jgi:hypothetical protein